MLSRAVVYCPDSISWSGKLLIPKQNTFCSSKCWFPKQWAQTIGPFSSWLLVIVPSICWEVQRTFPKPVHHANPRTIVCLACVLWGAESSASGVHWDSPFFLLTFPPKGTPLHLSFFCVIDVKLFCFTLHSTLQHFWVSYVFLCPLLNSSIFSLSPTSMSNYITVVLIISHRATETSVGCL